MHILVYKLDISNHKTVLNENFLTSGCKLQASAARTEAPVEKFVL